MSSLNISAQTRIQVMDIIDQMAHHYSKKDIEQPMSIVDDHFSGFGSGPDEKVTGKEEFCRHLPDDFTQCDVQSMEPANVQIYAEGTIA